MRIKHPLTLLWTLKRKTFQSLLFVVFVVVLDDIELKRVSYKFTYTEQLIHKTIEPVNHRLYSCVQLHVRT